MDSNKKSFPDELYCNSTLSRRNMNLNHSIPLSNGTPIRFAQRQCPTLLTVYVQLATNLSEPNNFSKRYLWRATEHFTNYSHNLWHMKRNLYRITPKGCPQTALHKLGLFPIPPPLFFMGKTIIMWVNILSAYHHIFEGSPFVHSTKTWALDKGRDEKSYWSCPLSWINIYRLLWSVVPHLSQPQGIQPRL